MKKKILTLTASLALNFAAPAFAADGYCERIHAAYVEADLTGALVKVNHTEIDDFSACFETYYMNIVEDGSSFEEKMATLTDGFYKTNWGHLPGVVDFMWDAMAVYAEHTPALGQTEPRRRRSLNPASWVGVIDGELMLAIGLYNEDGDNVMLFRVGEDVPLVRLNANG